MNYRNFTTSSTSCVRVHFDFRQNQRIEKFTCCLDFAIRSKKTASSECKPPWLVNKNRFNTELTLFDPLESRGLSQWEHTLIGYLIVPSHFINLSLKGSRNIENSSVDYSEVPSIAIVFNKIAATPVIIDWITVNFYYFS